MKKGVEAAAEAAVVRENETHTDTHTQMRKNIHKDHKNL